MMGKGIKRNGQLFSPTRLTVARWKRGMTQKEVAEAVGVSLPMMRKYEKGDAEPPRDRVETMSLVLRFPIDFFYGPEIQLLKDEDVFW